VVVVVAWLWYMCGEEHVRDRQTEGKKGGTAAATLQLRPCCVACQWVVKIPKCNLQVSQHIYCGG